MAGPSWSCQPLALLDLGEASCNFSQSRPCSPPRYQNLAAQTQYGNLSQALEMLSNKIGGVRLVRSQLNIHVGSSGLCPAGGGRLNNCELTLTSPTTLKPHGS